MIVSDAPKALVALNWSDLMALKACIQQALPDTFHTSLTYQKIETSFQELDNYIKNTEKDNDG